MRDLLQEKAIEMDDVDDDPEDYMEMAQTREVCNHRSEYIRCHSRAY